MEVLAECQQVISVPTEKGKTMIEKLTKLTELVNDVLRYLPWGQIGPKTAVEIADHLIANGVTVLTPDEARNIYTVQEIEKLQVEAYDLGAESVLHNRYGLSWHDAEKVRKEVAKLQSASKWIPVTERLPEDFGIYNIVVKDIDGVYRDSADFDPYEKTWIPTMGYTKNYVVTHWMPLPEPPKEE